MIYSIYLYALLLRISAATERQQVREVKTTIYSYSRNCEMPATSLVDQDSVHI